MSGNPPQLPSNILDALQIFANTAWHNPVAFLHTHHSSTSRDVEYLDVQNHLVALQYLFGNALAKYSKILVRDEYREALQALRTDSTYEHGAYIIGQPGIGKTYFLIYTLIERLREHKSVAVQLRASDPFYAFFTHTCTLYSLSDPAPLVDKDVWALSDLRVSTTTPLDIFLDVSGKVIQATPPGVKYWDRWSQHRGAEMFVMNAWSVEEVADISSLLGLDIERMTGLATRWGGVPQTLLRQSTNSEAQQSWELRRAAACAVDNHATLRTLDALDAGTTSMVFFVLPLKDHAGNICRRRYTMRVPTATLQNSLVTALRQMHNKTTIEFFLFMFIHPATRSCFRNIYVNWFYSRMTCGSPFRCDWLSWSYSSHYQELYRVTQIKDIPVTQDATKIAETPCFWIASCGKFPGVDCAVITHSAIFVFQMTTFFQPVYSSPQAGLDKLRTILPTPLQNNQQIPWFFTFIGISEELLNNTPTSWSGKPSTTYVGTCVVDPMQAGIPYKVYSCDDDWEMDYEGE